MIGEQTEIFSKFFVYYECIYEDSNSEGNMAGGWGAVNTVHLVETA